MKFHFRLMPVDAIPPWGTERGRPTLSWFSLTLGYFWIEINGQELFRYAGEVLAHWEEMYPEAYTLSLPYEDYQVARYWEDLLQMLPAILDPLPADFAERMTDPQAWMDWQDEAYRWQARSDDDESAWDAYYAALAWHGQRTWDAGHLAHPPHIWLWRVEDTIHIRWDNRNVTLDGLPVWEARQGEHTLPVSEFLAAVERFDSSLLSEMQERVDDLVFAAGRPGVEIDLAALLQAQLYRTTLLKSAIDPWVAGVRRGFSWEEMRDAIRRIEKEISPNE